MSYAMKVSKAQAMGDPGLFGFLGKAIGAVGKVAGILPGPLGLVGKVASVLTSGGAKPIKLATAGSLPGIGGRQVPFPGLPGVTMPVPRGPLSLFPQRGNIPQGGGGADWEPGTPGRMGACPTAGYHYNRTGYFTKRYGYIEKGSVCVKNRKRNPLNPRALSRAMARLTSAKRAARCLGEFSIRPRKACGCR